MKKIEIIGESYGGKWVRSRTACRGIVLRDGKISCPTRPAPACG